MKKLMVIPFVLVFAACAHNKGPMAMATLDSTSGSTAKGTVHFQNAGGDGVEVVADLTGVPPGVNAKGFPEFVQGWVGDEMGVWFGSDGKTLMQMTGKDWDAARATLPAIAIRTVGW